MSSLEETCEVAVPVRTAYNQWTRFRGFPRLMATVQRVEQVSPVLTVWAVGFGPLRREFWTEIVQQEPDSHLAWRSLGRRPFHEGEVSFRPTADGGTRITVRLRFEPRGAAGVLTRVTRLPHRVVRSELTHFKEHVEGAAEGEGWRGTVHNGHVRPAEAEPPRSRVPHWPVG